MRSLMWFRADLRAADNPALTEACRHATRGVIGAFLVAPDAWREHDWADVRVDFVRRSLEALQAELWKKRIPLLVETVDRFDDAPETLFDIARKNTCDAMYYNCEHEVNERWRDDTVTLRFRDEGLGVHAFHDQVLVAPGALRTGKGSFYTVFTPFRKAWTARLRDAGVSDELPAPPRQADAGGRQGTVPERVPGFDAVDAAIQKRWPAGEAAARKRLENFVAERLDDYHDVRDFPADDGTSALSPYLAVGAISPAQCVRAAMAANRNRLDGGRKGPDTWISELVWREFYRHILVGFPRVCMHQPFRLETERVAWRDDDAAFEAWCEGRTGVPIVDAAMRQLRATGWMHNRLRMVVAMFLTKNLLIDWRRGERWFMRHLIDGDLASNNGGWQWSASTGTDAAPYFRVFNPFSQSRKFDPDGAFIRRYVPELRDVEGDAVHDPSAIPELLRAGLDYPEPIVDVKATRQRAIEAFKTLK